MANKYEITPYNNGAMFKITKISSQKSIWLQGQDAVEFSTRLDNTTRCFSDDDLCKEYFDSINKERN